MDIKIGINIIVEDSSKLANAIARYADVEVGDITDDFVREFIEDSISIRNTRDDVFLVEGADTDGWMIQTLDCGDFVDEIYEED